ncbi:pantoate--beta-alanine ligase [Arthrobacter crystallopoietes]|uniref:pantoate--beta-alanine ligase n=1 Tax=Crystallibacter crystallopoietes TaxID=37928 RepID=UPI003D1C4687
MTRRPVLARTYAELNAASAELLGRAAASHHAGHTSLGLVPTMGALHEGHAALVRNAREANDVVVVSIFVNPLQFGEAADLERYPRNLEADLDLLAACGADIAFAPLADEVYPGGEPMVRISSGALGAKFEGASRPGHFDGALTVVAKLLHYGLPPVPADYRAYFGQKDAQQLALVRRMAADLDFPVEIVGVPTVRDADGLALSSRNRFLTPEQRTAALVLHRSLSYLKEQADRHEPLDVEGALAMIRSVLQVDLDYLEVVDPDSLEPLAFNCQDTPFTGEALALIAARVGDVRLIDNVRLG